MRLLRQKRYDEISVEDILGEADIGRSTFYAHCSGKNQLLRLSLRLLREELAAGGPCSPAEPRQAAPLFTFSLPLLQHLSEHSDLYPALARGRGKSLVLGELAKLVQDLAADDLRRMSLSKTFDPDLVLQFVSSGFVGLAAWWLDRRARTPAEEIDQAFQALMRNGLQSTSSGL